jgi:hypothetical protein
MRLASPAWLSATACSLELVEEVQIVSVDHPMVVAFVKGPLRVGGQARRGLTPELADGELVGVELVVAAAKDCLRGASVAIEQ